jgi:hypothetical protein
MSPTAAEVLAALAALPSTRVGGPYATDSGGRADIYINKTSTGAYWWKADMDIDTDGQWFPESDNNSDRQSETSFTQSDGKPLNSGTLPFIVIPLPSDRFRYRDHGIRGGDSCIVILNGRMVYAVFGDEGPSSIIGEASYAAAKALNVPGIPYSGWDGRDVTYIVFPGSNVRPIENPADRIAKGEANAAALIAAAGGTTPPVDPGNEEPSVTTIYFEETGPQGTVAANKVVQTALNKWRTFDRALYVDGIFGPVTRERYRRWQVELFDTTDTDISDGLPGVTSLTALGKRSVYPFTVARKTTTPPPPPPSSEIPPVTSYLTVPEPAHNYTRVTYGGRTVNVRTRELLKLAAAWAGVSINLSQGSYSSGVSASAGTHDGGGVVDISVSAWSAATRDRVVLCLRKAGFAAWLRTPAEGFSYHIHACAIGDREMAAAAKRQVQSYFDGRNGLANNGADYFEHRWPNWADKYNQ